MRSLVTAAMLAAATTSIVPPAAAQLNAYKREDLTKPLVLQPGQAAIVVGFRRPDKMSAGKSGAVAFSRYDMAARDLIFQPRDAKKLGDTTTYSVLAKSGDRNLPLDHAVLVVSPGDYVLSGATPGPEKTVTNTFCLRAPAFRVDAGEIVYFGDVTPYLFVKMKTGRGSAMAYSSHIDDVRKAFRGHAVANAIRPAQLKNGATYRCLGQFMSAYEVPDAPMIEDAATASKTAG